MAEVKIEDVDIIIKEDNPSEGQANIQFSGKISDAEAKLNLTYTFILLLYSTEKENERSTTLIEFESLSSSRLTLLNGSGHRNAAVSAVFSRKVTVDELQAEKFELAGGIRDKNGDPIDKSKLTWEFKFISELGPFVARAY